MSVETNLKPYAQGPCRPLKNMQLHIVLTRSRCVRKTPMYAHSTSRTLKPLRIEEQGHQARY